MLKNEISPKPRRSIARLIAPLVITGTMLAACAPAPVYPSSYAYYPPPAQPVAPAAIEPPDTTTDYPPAVPPSRPQRVPPEPLASPPAPDPQPPLAGPDPNPGMIDSRAPGSRCDDWYRLSNLWCE
jgi:hypothetical protein